MNLTMTIEGWEEHRIADALVEKVLAGIDASEKVEERIASMVSAVAEERIKDIADEEIRAAVQAKIAEGFQPTNTYGEPVGSVVSLKERIGKMLTEETGDYNRRERRVDRITREVIEQTFRTEFAKEIEAARAAFRKALDEELVGKIRETMKSALGVVR